MRQAFKMFTGSVAVYMAVASCAGMDVPSLSTSSAGGGGASGRAASSSGTTAGGPGGMATGNGGATGSVFNPVPPAQAESGTRLKARFMLGADGSKSFYDGGWWDTAMQVACVFVPVSDGSVRCAPVNQASVLDQYADAACTLRLAATVGTCSAIAATHAQKIESDTCASFFRVYALAGAVQPTDVYSKSSAGVCAKASLVPSFTYYALGAELPPSDFVAGTEGHE